MRVGLTSTVPVEFILAAGATPVDINNVFVSDPQAAEMVRDAELRGFPRNACAWVKGIHSSILNADFDYVIVVTRGDCAQMHAMMETLRANPVEFITFGYPYDRDPDSLRREMDRLADTLGTTWEAATQVRDELQSVREKVARLDELTWRDGIVTGRENHLYQVSCSDFGGDPEAFEGQVDELLARAKRREPMDPVRARIGYVGVPPIYSDLYEFLESLHVQVAFNEIQRQFTMAPCADGTLLTQYLCYTYPYDIYTRMDDIRREVHTRSLDGIIHYTQSFCYRQIYDHILRDVLDCPVLKLEGDRPGALSARDRLRIEAFAETLQARG